MRYIRSKSRKLTSVIISAAVIVVLLPYLYYLGCICLGRIPAGFFGDYVPVSTFAYNMSAADIWRGLVSFFLTGI